VTVFRAIELVDLALQSNSLPAVLTPGANNAARALVTSLVFCNGEGEEGNSSGDDNVAWLGSLGLAGRQ